MTASSGNLNIFCYIGSIILYYIILTFLTFSSVCVQRKEEQPKLLPLCCMKNFAGHIRTVHHVSRHHTHVSGVRVKALVATEESGVKIHTL